MHLQPFVLMNYLFRPYLRKFVLIIFDDIFIYTANLEEHLVHFQLVFQVLLNNQLYAKLSKCRFGVASVDYLGHIVSGKGVVVDPSKVQAVWEWPIPKSLKALRVSWV